MISIIAKIINSKLAGTRRHLHPHINLEVCHWPMKSWSGNKDNNFEILLNHKKNHSQNLHWEWCHWKIKSCKQCALDHYLSLMIFLSGCLCWISVTVVPENIARHWFSWLFSQMSGSELPKDKSCKRPWFCKGFTRNTISVKFPGLT